MSSRLLLNHSILVELMQLVDPSITEHWNPKVRRGVITADVESDGPFDPVKFARHMRRLLLLEAHAFGGLFEGPWGDASPQSRGMLHYFGIGDAKAFKVATAIANYHHHDVIGYDASDDGCVNGLEAIRELREDGLSKGNNDVFLADVELTCNKRYIPRPKRNKKVKMALSRVAGILDKEDPDWEKRPVDERKMARTMINIGELTAFVDVLPIHGCSKDNPNAVLGDSTPRSFEEIRGYMDKKSEFLLHLSRLGVAQFYNQWISAVLIQSIQS